MDIGAIMANGDVVELDRDQFVELHRELWGWLAENPNAEKDDWPGWEKYDWEWADDNSYCFACAGAYNGCDRCLLVWPGRNCCDDEHYNEEGLFTRWDSEESLEKRKELAIQIRDLPVREE